MSAALLSYLFCYPNICATAANALVHQQWPDRHLYLLLPPSHHHPIITGGTCLVTIFVWALIEVCVQFGHYGHGCLKGEGEPA